MANSIITYTDDLHIAQSIVRKDEQVTIDFLYVRCYPLFNSVFHRFYTDCSCVREFIDEIYLLVMTPSKVTGKVKLENYRGESTLFTWFKVVALSYCFKKFKRRIDVVEQVERQEKNTSDDSFAEETASIGLDFTNMNSMDVEMVINLMPNLRYRAIIRLRYLEDKSNEETAQILGMSMENYYNSHKRAKDQYLSVLRKEEHHG